MGSVRIAPRLRKGTRFECIVPDGCDGHCCWGDGTIYIFEEDIARLLDHFQVDLDTLLDEHVKVDEVPCADHDGTMPVLSIKEVGAGACKFQVNGLCSIHPARPFQCRGYPFWKMYVSTNEGWEKLVEFCPGAARAGAGEIEGATRYTKAAIKQLVQEELDMDERWEAAMVKHGADYKAHLREYLDRRKKE